MGTTTKKDIYNRIHDRVELRDLEINQPMSEETLCYSATVVVDGEIACTAKNRGRGGKTFLTAYLETNGDERTRHKNVGLLREIADELPPVEGQLGEIEYDPEMIVDLVAGHEDLLDAAQNRSENGYLVFKYDDQPLHAFEYVKQEEGETDALLLSLIREQNRASEEDRTISHVFRDGKFEEVSDADFIVER
jgi:hypothetical protein